MQRPTRFHFSHGANYISFPLLGASKIVRNGLPRGRFPHFASRLKGKAVVRFKASFCEKAGARGRNLAFGEPLFCHWEGMRSLPAPTGQKLIAQGIALGNDDDVYHAPCKGKSPLQLCFCPCRAYGIECLKPQGDALGCVLIGLSAHLVGCGE